MGYSCDVCHTDAPAIYCFADKAVMCAACDRKVHSANKLAQKHERVVLTQQAEGSHCDICQEEKAIMFCSEDRALICRRCDLMIHTANEFTKTHHRHLLSGISPGLHALPAGCLTEPNAAPPRSTRAATAAAHQSGASGTSASASPAPSTAADAQSPAHGGQDQGAGYGAVDQGFGRFSTTGSARGGDTKGMQHSESVGALINVCPVQGNPADSLMDNSQMRSRSTYDNSAYRGSAAASASTAFGASGAQAGTGSSAAAQSYMEPGFGGRSSSLTLAADLLGMPFLQDEYNAKDIDAVYFGEGTDNDLDDWASFLEVPDFMTTFATSQGAGPSGVPSNIAFEQPMVSVRDPQLGQKVGDIGGNNAPLPSFDDTVPDCVVPEVPALKKQRV